MSCKPEERIEGSILITYQIDHPSSDEYRGKLNVILQRPIYKTSYNSSLLNYVDNDFKFKYVESQVMDYSENTYTSNLTSVISILFEYLSGDGWRLLFIKWVGQFFLSKGTGYCKCCTEIRRDPGWKAFENQRNRYWLAENYLNPSYTVCCVKLII